MKMKKELRKFIALAMVVSLPIMSVGCTKDTSTKDSGASNSVAESYDPGSTMKLQFAKNFKIDYLKDGMKIVTDGQGKQLLLLQKDQEAPEQYKDLPSVTIPLKDAIFTSTTQVAYLRAFEDDSVFDSIVGVRATKDDWNFDAMKTRMESGQIKDIGSNTMTDMNYDYEVIQSLNPKMVFTTQGMGTEQQKLMDMLNGSNIPYVFDASSTEDDYRGTMEWMKLYSAFYNLEEEAQKDFDKAIKNVDEMKETVKDAEKPKVGWGIVSMGKVYVENAGSKSAQMVRDAGAQYLFDDIGVGQDGVTSISVEELYSRLSDADIFINRGMPKYGPDKKSITDQAPILADLECFKEDKVWQITDDFWSTYHNIDQKYVDLAAMFHPELYKDHKVKNFLLMPDVAK
ncbi:ABC transporter substrate-binding protein [Romboutsia sp.]|uniref:ABC transporter substrate-binding protein n=1 Tax=Romboutsia sp. TaxID=1965302 RepID=UPI002CC5C317|nr:ABC transporter substrate-binding protein [Romboutsia sp.]HSQ87820.1 ABC transporter substrate-binding protein [Romboutsia sp.]